MNKNIMALLLTILAALGAPSVVDELTDTTPEAVVQLIGPDNCEIGELVKFTYNARKVEWILPTEDSATVNNESVVMSFRSPGEYQVIVSGLIGNEVQLLKHMLTVNGPEPVVIVVDEDDPVPAPEPDDLVNKSELTNTVRQWCEEANSPADTCKTLGDNFIDAASTSKTKDELIRVTSESNRKVDQDGVAEVLTKIQVWMIQNLTNRSFDEHKCAWDEIGQGFLTYAEGTE